jgi:hypothetical protein
MGNPCKMAADNDYLFYFPMRKAQSFWSLGQQNIKAFWASKIILYKIG